jgi:hypothetical protein
MSDHHPPKPANRLIINDPKNPAGHIVWQGVKPLPFFFLHQFTFCRAAQTIHGVIASGSIASSRTRFQKPRGDPAFLLCKQEKTGLVGFASLRVGASEFTALLAAIRASQ